jgi:hypothetical protein
MEIARTLRGLLLLWGALLAAAAPAQTIVSRTDLSATFAASPGWRLLAFQGPGTPDDFEPEGRAPGAILLCVSRDGGRSCHPDLSRLLTIDSEPGTSEIPHYLDQVRIVRPRPGHALLLVETAGLHSGDGDQRVWTAALSYDGRRNEFAVAYQHHVGRNNNQEIRYIAGGPLRGAIVSVEPTGDAPFGFWVAVNRLAPSGRYRQVLRYRSATHYGDGNPLAVIDSEMPNIQQRLGLWRPGRALPLPARGCRRPRLINHELWC